MRWVVAGVAVLAIVLSVWQLEQDRAGLSIGPLETAGGPPATLYLPEDGGAAPAVVIAHGFAGSRQLMESYALSLARAGYIVASFDFMGHGRNPRPMSGDVTSVDGTTRLMQAEVQAVARAVLALPRADGRLAYLGHSMASDIIVRAALEEPKPEAVVAVSMFSQAVTAVEPANLLVIVGDWEARLKDEALRAMRLADPGAVAGQTVGDMAAGTGRRAVFAPGVEHVGVLYSATAQREAILWLDGVFGRVSDAVPVQRGGWILVLLAGITALAWPLARFLPKGPAVVPVPRPAFLLAALGPVMVVPLVLWPVDIRILPVLVADYLTLHFALYGALTLAILARYGGLAGQFGPRVWRMAPLIAAVCLLMFGLVLDRYVASFVPQGQRVLIILGLALGAVPFMLGDALLTEGGKAPVWRVLLARGGFLLSLMLAVALDFAGLMFLLIILPVILLFFLLFGTIAGWIGRRTGLPAAAGLGLGLVLAWSLGVTFPIFAP